MKNFRFLVLFVALISAAQLFADSQSDTKARVALSEKLYISVTSGPHRAPARRHCPVILLHDGEKQVLEFSSTSGQYGIIINMYDEDEKLVSTNIINILPNETSFVSIIEYTQGEYRLEVIIDDICYEGSLVIV